MLPDAGDTIIFEEAIPMQETLRDFKTRRSIRKFKSEPVPRDLLDQVLEAGTYAPTGMNSQSPIIVAITNPEMVRRVAELNAAVMNRGGDPFYGAPAVLVVLSDRTKMTHVYDGSLVMGNLLNAAHAVGLGATWIHRAKEVFDSPEGKALLKEWGIEGDYEGIGNCIIGIPDEEPVTRPRKEGYIIRVE